ncbi:hypothetical protein GT045_27355 [Streptomyces sp. SID486]|uniref:hypothetical protein n=1 Tax=unclassified Streptomyces TaxID=2593676 RepID=UPI001367E090|nr:hypothetical protein [Streptomyces sp. SID161]MYX98420.1 hypothetical protein [Streptomyces sp. SID486]
MLTKQFIVTGALAASLALGFVPAAHASAAPVPSAGHATQGSDRASRSAAAADGLLHAWTDPFGGGTPCFWEYNSDNWGPCRNKASDIWNNGYATTLDAVDLYSGVAGTEAHACISRGDSWNNLPSGQWRFTYGAGLPQFGKSVNDNISSHRWVDYCSQG